MSYHSISLSDRLKYFLKLPHETICRSDRCFIEVRFGPYLYLIAMIDLVANQHRQMNSIFGDLMEFEEQVVWMLHKPLHEKRVIWC